MCLDIIIIMSNKLITADKYSQYRTMDRFM